MFFSVELASIALATVALQLTVRFSTRGTHARTLDSARDIVKVVGGCGNEGVLCTVSSATFVEFCNFRELTKGKLH